MATILVFHNEVAFKFFHHSWVYKIFPEIILRIFLLQFSLLCTTKKFFTNALQIRISWTFHTYLVFRYWESFSNVSFIPFFVFGFLALLATITKILFNLCLHFPRQDGQDWKKTGKKITQLKWLKYQKPKQENMGWMKHNMYWYIILNLSIVLGVHKNSVVCVLH